MTDKRKQNKRNPWWILGAVLFFIITKGKSLLLALSKFAGPLISMAVTVGAYALLSPIWFAVGLVLLILVHELGHVIAAKRKGLPVSAPLFIPFIGALITMKRHPKDAVTEAYIAYGGPLVGTIGALIVYAAGLITEMSFLFVLANVGFFINLINLLPIHPLDGGRISTAVSRWLWVPGLIGGAVLIIVMKSPLLFIIWALFAWDLYQKFFRYRKSGKPYHMVGVYEIDIQQLGLPAWYFSGEQHARELPFTTYSKLSGEQIVRFDWETLNFRGKWNSLCRVL
ncbi:site-2 protease family protein [Paenibacillus abyssi]|uniref:site-2 protease family protein n=1 Tax=Paenibacillus abyssi TaxID=1340531 RepID=UPI003609CD68